MAKSSKVFQKSTLFLIRMYQKVLSPFLGQRCRFYPSCSAYMYEAIEQFGPIKGTFKGLVRLSKCHPGHPGGYDPVVPQPSTSSE